MKTFAPARPFVHDPGFRAARTRALADLDPAALDAPIQGLMEGFASIPHCFTLQCCWGHFVHPGRPDRHGVQPLDAPDAAPEVEYRLAYVALCIENSEAGRALRDDLAALVRIDPDRVQFGSAQWFWQRRVNTYAVQVMPGQFKGMDTARVGMNEALRLEAARNRLFAALHGVVDRHTESQPHGKTKRSQDNGAEPAAQPAALTRRPKTD